LSYVFPGDGIQSTLSGAILAGATTFPIQSADVSMFPSAGNYPCVLFNDAANGPWEIVHITGGQGTASLTGPRAAEPFRGVQAAYGWASGTKIVPVVTQTSILNPMFASLVATGRTVLGPPTVPNAHGVYAPELVQQAIAGIGQAAIDGSYFRYHWEQTDFNDLCLWVDQNFPGNPITAADVLAPFVKLITQTAADGSFSGPFLRFDAFPYANPGDVTHSYGRGQISTSGAAGAPGFVLTLYANGSVGSGLYLDGGTGNVRTDGPITAPAFNATTPPVVTGSRGTDAWRTSVMAALVSLGLVTDSSTA
jgi:hypothetical protein